MTWQNYKKNANVSFGIIIGSQKILPHRGIAVILWCIKNH